MWELIDCDSGVFLDYETFRRSGRGVQKTLVKHVIRFIGKNGEISDQLRQLSGAFRVTGIGTDHQNTAGKQKFQCLIQCFSGGFPLRCNRMIPAREPAKIEYNGPNLLGNQFSHMLMAFQKEVRTTFQVPLPEQ